MSFRRRRRTIKNAAAARQHVATTATHTPEMINTEGRDRPPPSEAAAAAPPGPVPAEDALTRLQRRDVASTEIRVGSTPMPAAKSSRAPRDASRCPSAAKAAAAAATLLVPFRGSTRRTSARAGSGAAATATVATGTPSMVASSTPRTPNRDALRDADEAPPGSLARTSVALMSSAAPTGAAAASARHGHGVGDATCEALGVRD